MISTAGTVARLQRAASTDEERDESIAANRSGFSFLFVHALTWTAAAALTTVLPLETAALVYMFQGFVAFPASLMLERALGYRTLSAKENSLVNLFVLIAMAQGLALPASIVAYSLDPRYVPIVFAATNGGHFLPYSWLYRTPAYAVLSVVCALGPFAILVATGPDSAFGLSGLLVGLTLLAGAFFVHRSSAARR